MLPLQLPPTWRGTVRVPAEGRDSDVSLFAPHLFALEVNAALPRFATCFAVNLGAGDGFSCDDPVMPLFRAGFAGLAVDAGSDPDLFSNLPAPPIRKAQRTAVTPGNVVALLEAGGCPERPDFFKIDGYNGPVLSEVLKAGYRPKVIQAGVQPEVPPAPGVRRPVRPQIPRPCRHAMEDLKVSPGSVSGLLGCVKDGDPAAIQCLWERYFARLVTLARSRMINRRAAADEEDVALSAFDSFCRGAKAGRYPRLDDRDELWRLLVHIVTCKALDHAQHEQRLKRGGPDGPEADVDWTAVLGSDPTPDFAAEVAEQCELLLKRLGDETLRLVAIRKMEGFTVSEIAAELSVCPRTVERKLGTIRDLWRRKAASE